MDNIFLDILRLSFFFCISLLYVVSIITIFFLNSCFVHIHYHTFICDAFFFILFLPFNSILFFHRLSNVPLSPNPLHLPNLILTSPHLTSPSSEIVHPQSSFPIPFFLQLILITTSTTSLPSTLSPQPWSALTIVASLTQ